MTGAESPDLGIELVNITLLAILFVISVAIARLRNLFAIVMLLGVYSLVSATWFVVVDAVDVAFTEAAVGAGASTILLLGAILLAPRKTRERQRYAYIAPLIVVLVTGALLIHATIDLPALGDANSPANTHVGALYLERHYPDMGFPNMVTSILASYRGFDTLGEVFVVFTAGLAVALLLGFGEKSLASRIRKSK